MKKFRWILLSGLLVAATSIAQAQPPGAFPGNPEGVTGEPNSAVDAGGITNAPGVTTTTTTTGIAPDVAFVPVDDALVGETSSLPDTGGEPMIAILAGLSIAGAAVAMRRKVTA